MKVATLAVSTLESLIHKRLIVLVLILEMCVVLLMLTPLLRAKGFANPGNHEAIEAMVLESVSMVMSFISALGTILAAWCAADALHTELKAGTVLAVMARPVKRWEFLLGKYMGVMLFMLCYVVLMIGVSHLLVWIAGMKLQANPLILLLYPIMRYAIYAGLAILLATVIHPTVTMGVLLAVSLVTDAVMPGTVAWMPKLMWLKTGLYYMLPSTNLLTEGRFLSLRQAAIKQANWLEHGVTLAYGLDCALILVLLAMWSFHYRSLKQD